MLDRARPEALPGIRERVRRWLRSGLARKRKNQTRIEKLFIPGAAGKLEALLEFNPQASARLAAVVCHPHPMFGGTMHNKVVFRAAKAAHQAGVPTLRFNFRGVGASEGKYDEGRGERQDVRAALDFISGRFTGTPACVVGFSFGAWVGMAEGAADSRVRAVVGLGLPLDTLNFDFLREVRKPKFILQGTEDQFAARARVEALFRALPEPKTLRWVENVDHFFTGKLEVVEAAVEQFFEEMKKP